MRQPPRGVVLTAVAISSGGQDREIRARASAGVEVMSAAACPKTLCSLFSGTIAFLNRRRSNGSAGIAVLGGPNALVENHFVQAAWAI